MNRNRSSIIQRIATAVAIVLGTFAALPIRAAEVVQSGAYSVQSTNWLDNLSLDKFDGTLGSLESVELTLSGAIHANAGYENLATVNNDVTLNAAADIAGTFHNDPLLAQYGFHLTITPANTGTFWSIPGFDGTNDFSGNSGLILTGLTGTATDTLSTALVDAFHPVIRTLIHEEFTDQNGIQDGLETIDMRIEASGASMATDVHGNVATLFQTSASGGYSLVYTYSNSTLTGAVPEPNALVLLIAGLFVGGLCRPCRRYLR